MANESSTKPTYEKLRKLAEKARDFVPEPLKCVYCGKEMIQSTAPTASGAIWMDRCKDGQSGHTYSITTAPTVNASTQFTDAANPNAILELLSELVRVRGLLQRLFTFARHEEDCPAWGFHRPTGAYWAADDETKCYCKVGEIFKLAQTPSEAEVKSAISEAQRIHGDMTFRAELDPNYEAAFVAPNFPQSSLLVPQGAESADIRKLDTADKSGVEMGKVNSVDEKGSAETGGEKA